MKKPTPKTHGIKLITGILIATLILLAVTVGYGVYLYLTTIKNSQPSSLVISEASLEIRDPAKRNLSSKTEMVTLPSGSQNRYLIRDDNESYFHRCEYPIAIWSVDSATAEAVLKQNSDASKEQYKKIGENWYRVGLGTHWRSECSSTTDSDEDYIVELQKYVLDNLSALPAQ